MPPVLQRRQYQIFIDRAPGAVFAFLANPQNHARLCPDDQTEEVVGDAETLASSAHVHYRTKQGGVWRMRETEITDWDPPHGFAERQITGPFAQWIHRRKLAPFQLGTLVTEQIEYSLSAGPLGALAEKLWLGKRMDELFHHRQSEAKRHLERIGRIKGR